jgi:ADP-ribosylation factor-binding protein GGA
MWNNNPVGNWPRSSTLEFLITRATTAAQPENNYALHIEIAEYINKKKANRYITSLTYLRRLANLSRRHSPREAAMLIVQAVNHRNPHVSLLALGLLDTLVQMCGYPLHLQISTKEFLNELVRRFPERPPPFPGPVMTRILELIHGWKEGICVESRWRDDLGNIRDMHRLLSFKGYRFRDIPRTTSSAPPTSVAVSLPYPYVSHTHPYVRTSSLQKNLKQRTEMPSLPSYRSSFGGGLHEISPPLRNS